LKPEINQKEKEDILTIAVDSSFQLHLKHIGTPALIWNHATKGELVIRGIEIRKHDIPNFIKQFQAELLYTLFNCKANPEVRRATTIAQSKVFEI